MIELEELRTRFHDDPVGFVKTLFNCEPQEWQKEALNSLVHHDRIAIRAGHGVGKTTYLSWVIYWWLSTRSPCKIACTSPSAKQLRDALWAELQEWRTQMPKKYQKLFKKKADSIVLKDDPSSFAVARTSRRDQPEAFQGLHSDNMLFIVDEASGVDDIIFEVGAGSMSTAGAKTLMVGNPTRSSGKFYNCFHKSRDHWHVMHVPCSASTTVSPDFCKTMEDEYGIDSNIYRIRVLGEFGRADDNTVIPLYLCEDAIDRDVMRSDIQPIIWGVDIARFGNDKTALAKRQGNYLLEHVKTWSNQSVTQVAGLIKREFDDAPLAERPREIMIDVIGFGAGVHDMLKEAGYPVKPVNVAEATSVYGRYGRLRDELWFKARDWLQGQNVRIPRDDALIAELTLPRFSYDSQGRMIVEKKDEMKKRGITSPDRADAFCLTFASTARPYQPGEIDDNPFQHRRRYETAPNYGRTWMSA